MLFVMPACGLSPPPCPGLTHYNQGGDAHFVHSCFIPSTYETMGPAFILGGEWRDLQVSMVLDSQVEPC